MIREIIRSRETEMTLGVLETRLASVRSRDIETTAVRVYDNGLVGIASGVGKVDIDDLTRRAVESLALEMPHAPGPVLSGVGHTSAGGETVTQRQLADQLESYLARVRSEHPNLMLGNKLGFERSEVEIQNDAGLHRSHSFAAIGGGLSIRVKGSPNILDGFVGFQLPTLDPDFLYEQSRRELALYDEPAVPLDAGETTIVWQGISSLEMKLRPGLVARNLDNGSSIFAGKMGQQLFSPRFSLASSRDTARYGTAPFDAEGFVRAMPELWPIEEGVLRFGLASRRDAALCGAEPTGSAAGPVRSIPSTSAGQLRVRGTHDTLTEILGGQPAFQPLMVLGGDMTEQGDFAMPVAVGWMLDAEGQPVARVTNATITGNLYAALGDGFIGATHGPGSPLGPYEWLVTRAGLA